MKKLKVFALLTLALLVLAACSGSKAKDLKDEAVEFYRIDNYEKALEYFQEAQETKKNEVYEQWIAIVERTQGYVKKMEAFELNDAQMYVDEMKKLLPDTFEKEEREIVEEKIEKFQKEIDESTVLHDDGRALLAEIDEQAEDKDYAKAVTALKEMLEDHEYHPLFVEQVEEKIKMYEKLNQMAELSKEEQKKLEDKLKEQQAKAEKEKEQEKEVIELPEKQPEKKPEKQPEAKPNNAPMYSRSGQTVSLKGISLNMTESAVQAKLGEPEATEDEAGIKTWLYDNGQLIISMYAGRVDQVIYSPKNMSLAQLQGEFQKVAKEKRYKDDYGGHFYYNEGEVSLLMIKDEDQPAAYLLYPDDNFLTYMEEGDYYHPF